MKIDIILAFIALFFTLTVSFFVLYNNYKDRVNKSFFFLCLPISLWIISNICANTAENYNVALFFTRVSIIWVALLPILFNKLIAYLYFLDDNNYKERHNIIFHLSLTFISIIILSSQTSWNVESISIQKWGIDYVPGISYYILFIYFIIAFGFSFWNLFNVYRTFIEPRKSQAKFILIGTSVTVTVTVIMDIILPAFGYSFSGIFAPSLIIFFIGSTTYSISRHHLFNIKLIAVEIVTFSLWIFMLIRILTSETIRSALIESGILAITVVFGIILIKSVLHEIKQRQKIESMAKDLQKAYETLKELNPS